MANSRPNPSPPYKTTASHLRVSRLQHGWLKAMGVDVPWISAEELSTTSQAARPSDVVATPGKAGLPRPAPELGLEQTPVGSGLRPTVLPTAVLASALESASSESLPERDVSRSDMSQLAQMVQSCQRCGLCQTRQQAVPGDGVQKPTILVVGEAPGEQEDIQGRPFVGRSGQLLDNMLKSIGHGRDSNVFITNVVKCRPPANRNPREEEILACAPYLERQIELLQPKAILAMGRFAAQALLETEAPLQKLRESVQALEFGGQPTPVVVTYHPAYLLRRPVDKRLAWEDLKRLKALLA